MFFAFLALTALALSFGIELIAEVKPCHLCLWQRASYFVLFILVSIGIFIQNKKIVLSLVLATFLVSFLIASYHLAIQYGILNDTCKIKELANINDFEKMLFEPVIPCAKVGWAIGGIPMSAINAVTSLICLSITGLKLLENDDRTLPLCNVHSPFI